MRYFLYWELYDPDSHASGLRAFDTLTEAIDEARRLVKGGHADEDSVRIVKGEEVCVGKRYA